MFTLWLVIWIGLSTERREKKIEREVDYQRKRKGHVYMEALRRIHACREVEIHRVEDQSRNIEEKELEKQERESGS